MEKSICGFYCMKGSGSLVIQAKSLFLEKIAVNVNFLFSNLSKFFTCHTVPNKNNINMC